MDTSSIPIITVEEYGAAQDVPDGRTSLEHHKKTVSVTPVNSKEGMNLSFAGCGFLGIYHVGVSACLRKYAPELLVERIAGASAGALAAACLLCDADLGFITSSVLKTATEARARALGPFSPTFDVEKLLREGLLSVLPPNAHEIVSGRLFISVTRVSDGKNILLSQFKSRDDLIQALLCSSFIPGFSGYRPLSLDGVRYMDGGFSDNLPELDRATITVSPFCGEADVCPKDHTAGLLTVSLANTSIEISRENLQRFARILFPPPPETLNRMCQQGFNDALDFLQRNNLMACTRCVAVQSVVPLDTQDGRGAATKQPHHTGPKPTPSCEDGFDDCPDCRLQRQAALLDELPETVGAILQEAIDSANAEVNKLFSLSSPMKLLSILSMPAVYSIKLPFKIMKGMASSLPTMQGLRQFTAQVYELIRTILLSRRPALVADPLDTLHHHHHRAGEEPTFSCNVAVTEFKGSDERKRMSMDLSHLYEEDLSDTEGGYTSENEALSRLAVQYAMRSSRSGSLIPTLGLSRAASRATSRAPSAVPSRSVSRAMSRRTSICSLDSDDMEEPNIVNNTFTEDAFDRILNVTNEQEALMAYYYLDENNQMQVTEIFDMSAVMPDHDEEDDVVPASHYMLQPSYRRTPTTERRSILRNNSNGGHCDQQQQYIEEQLHSFKEKEEEHHRSNSSSSEPEADQHHPTVADQHHPTVAD